MSKLVAVVGDSGHGKTTSLESLDPDKTFVINVAGKDLPFKGSRNKYNEEKKNYKQTSDHNEITKLLKYVSAKRPEIKMVVIDDFQYIMSTEFVNRATERGYDKFSEMAQHVFQILSPELHTKLRDDLYVVILTHDDEQMEGGKPRRKLKTIGKMLDEKVTLEGLFTVVLFTELIKKDDSPLPDYRFRTQTDGTCTAKSPRGMFDELLIPNDLNLVLRKMEEYYN